MRTILLILFAGLSFTVGCSSPSSSVASSPSNSQPETASVNINANTDVNSNRLFTILPDGQVQRITNEGYGDELIRQNIADINKTVTYALLEKDADKYKGSAWGFNGRVLQIFEKSGQTKALIEYKPGQNFWVYANFPTDFVKGNRVYAIGYLAGSETYKTISNWELTVPVLIARAIMKPKDVSKYKVLPEKKGS